MLARGRVQQVDAWHAGGARWLLRGCMSDMHWAAACCLGYEACKGTRLPCSCGQRCLHVVLTPEAAAGRLQLLPGGCCVHAAAVVKKKCIPSPMIMTRVPPPPPPLADMVGVVASFCSVAEAWARHASLRCTARTARFATCIQRVDEQLRLIEGGETQLHMHII